MALRPYPPVYCLPDPDVGRVRELLSEIEEALGLLDELFSRPREEFLSSWRDRFAARYLLMELVEACSSLGVHLLEALRNRVPSSYAQVFNMMAEEGLISWRVAEGMRKLAGLRNLLVHRYWEVDDGRIYDEARAGGLELIREFMREVRAYLASRIGAREGI